MIAPLLGLDAGMGAAIGFVCLFCGVVNCPVASIMLALEVFGGNNLLIFAVAVVVSYVMSGRKGLYRSQKISYSKIENKIFPYSLKEPKQEKKKSYNKIWSQRELCVNLK